MQEQDFEHVSLDELQERENSLLLPDEHRVASLHAHTPVDRFMELNDGLVGESEEDSKRAEYPCDVLRERSFQSYEPFGSGLQL